MTVSSTIRRNDYAGSGTVGPFSYTFRIFAASDLLVSTRDPDGNEYTLTYPVDYSVTGVQNRTGGTVTLATALAVGWVIAIQRVLPLLQTTELRNEGTYYPESIEDTFDAGVMISQQVQGNFDRTLQFPTTVDTDVVSTELPPPVPSASFFWNNAGTALESKVLDDSDNVALPGAGRTVSTLTALLANNAVFNIKDYGAVGNGSADDTAAITLCLSNAPAGSFIRIPNGSYKVYGTGDSIFTISKELFIVCDSDLATILVDASTPTTTDILTFKSAGFLSGCGFFNGCIRPVSGNPGRSNIVIDATLGQVAYFHIDNVNLNALTGPSIQGTNPSLVDGYFNGTITNNRLEGGMDLDNAGDTILIQGNTFYSTSGNANQRGITIAQVYGTVDGAHALAFRDNSVTCAGNFELFSGNGAIIEGNNFECPWPSTSTNHVLVDLAGTALTPMVKVHLRDNEIGAGFAGPHVGYAVRFDYCYGAESTGNKIGPPPGGKAYLYTANSEANSMDGDMLHQVGLLLGDYREDHGKGNIVKSWITPAGTGNQRAMYFGHSSSTSNTILTAAGKSQATTSVLYGILPADYAPVTVTLTAGALLNATSLTVSALGGPIRAFTTLLFSGTKVATVASSVNAGVTTIPVIALGQAINNGEIAVWSGRIDPAVQGHLRVMGNGNVICGDGPDSGSPVQVFEGSYFSGQATHAGDVAILAGKRLLGVDTASTVVPWASFNEGASNNVRIGAQIATATAGDLEMYARGVLSALLNNVGLKVIGGFGCNGTTAQVSYAVGGAATDLASVLTLANNMRLAGIANGTLKN